MKGFFNFIVTTILAAALGIFLITENPSTEDFSKWYVKNNSTEMGAFFDNVYEGIVSQQTKKQDYVLFSVFELKKAKYVGIGGHFFSRDFVEEAKQNTENLIESARQQMEEEKRTP